MSDNKHALIRYKTLDKCFRNAGKKYFFKDLQEEIDNVLLEIDPAYNGISRRQVFDDIAFMESKDGWNIELLRYREGRKVYYRYADTGFSINDMPLNETEINQLQSAIDILTQFKGMPQFDWMQELVPKLKQGLAVKNLDAPVMEFDSNQYLKGIEYLGTLYNAIFYKKVLEVAYQPFENETPLKYTLHPYFLKQYNNRWFVFGYNPEEEKFNWNLAIDRIVAINEVKGRYQKNTQINWQEYFDDIVGVTKTEKSRVQQIVLHFYGKAGHYIETKPLHGSQKAKWIDAATLEVRLQLIMNYELERVILSFGETVKVIKPLSLMKTIKTRLYNAHSKYSDQ